MRHLAGLFFSRDSFGSHISSFRVQLELANLAEQNIVCNPGGSRAPIVSVDAQLRGNKTCECKIGGIRLRFPNVEVWDRGGRQDSGS